MAWDISRPVPWQRLMREWLIYAAIMTAIFVLIFRDSNTIGAVAGVFISGPMYLGFGWILAKFGYQRKTLKELRTPQASASEPDDGAVATANVRTVAPSSRTAGGGNRPASKKKRRR